MSHLIVRMTVDIRTYTCRIGGSIAHPGVQLDVGAVLGDERAAVGEVGDVCHAAAAAGVVGSGPVVGAPLVLVLQGGQLNGLDVQAGVHELPHPGDKTRAGELSGKLRPGKKVLNVKPHAAAPRRDGDLSRALRCYYYYQQLECFPTFTASVSSRPAGVSYTTDARVL